MKILLISDSHGRKTEVTNLICNTSCDYVFFMGDGLRDVDEIDDSIIKKVCGNCDFFSSEAVTRFENIDNYKIMITHGHEFRAKNGFDNMVSYAKKHNCNIVVFGHIHQQTNKIINDVLLVNPGAFKKGDYAILTLSSKSNPIVEFKNIDDNP
ncbi:MAG: metallophosphoesterase family protein [Clostridia bacterium]|nr:metallophosphoesterase family protein [Clostridia bacterium]